MVSFTPSKRPKTPTHKLRKSEASGVSGRRSLNGSDYGSIPFPTSPASSLRAGTGTLLSSESERVSRFSSSETHVSHLSHLFYKPHSTHDRFDFTRPVRDEDIEAHFDYVSMICDLPSGEQSHHDNWCTEQNNCDGRRRRVEKSTLGSRMIQVQ
jgi:cytokinesis protein